MTEKRINKETVNSFSKEFNKLSIQVSLNGFSFCVVDTINGAIVKSELVSFAGEQTPYHLKKKLASLFNKYNLNKDKFSEVVVIHRNKLFSFVPKSLFDEAEMPNYLKFNAKILANDHIVFDELDNYDMVNVYVPFVNINNYIYELFGEFIFKHSGTVMVESLLSNQSNVNEPQCFVHVTQKEMEVAIISQKKLLLYNSFNFNSKEDFIYYLLFTLEQLKLDTETIKLKLFGSIEEGDLLYNICYSYVKHVSIFVPSNPTYLTELNKTSVDFTILNTL